ncbi:MAG: acyl-CoA dehydrogenase family protein [Bdellovibrionota bacterium]
MSNTWKLSKNGLDALNAISAVAAECIEKRAQETDSQARFPIECIGALRDAGTFRLISSADVGGRGEGLRAAAAAVERIAQECASTAMITTMHYCATAVLEKYAPESVRRSISEGKTLATLAFSESGSRSHFWLPVSSAESTSEGIRLNARKQLITAAGKADIYVWSSRPATADGLSSIWSVPSNSKGLSLAAPFDGLGLRGNCSAPIVAEDVIVPKENILGEDGKGFDVMMSIVMPYFSILNASVSLGMTEGVFRRTIQHVTSSKYSYDDSALSALPQVRGHVAKMRVKIDLLRGFLLDALDALESSREDGMLRVLVAKVAGAETSLEVHDLAMRVSGGAAFRKDTAIERFFRDSRAATVMAPVSDALYDFIGKAVCGLPVFG